MIAARDALVLIDVQSGFDDPFWGPHNKGNFNANVLRLLESWRSKRLPIFHVQHVSELPTSPLRGGQPGVEFMSFVAPREGEIVMQKKVNSAFLGTPLEYWLRRMQIGTVVLAGISTDHCVSTTARMGANLGLTISVVSDATFTFDRRGMNGRVHPAEEVHQVALASLSEEFASIVSTDELVR
jgi:nicotinamidase-related amidase